MDLHPTGVEFGDDAVEIDAQTHRDTLRTSRYRRAAIIGAAALLTIAGCGGGDDGPTRSYSLGLEVDDSMQEYDYLATGTVDIQVGDEVTFELDNTGALIHDLNVVDPDGRTIARAEPVAPGQSASVTALFEQSGFYRLSCFVDDHFIEHQMFTFVEVTDPNA